MPRMVHPETGGSFDAPERAVSLYQRSGWTLEDQPGAGDGGQPPGPAGKGKSAADTPATSPQEK